MDFVVKLGLVQVFLVGGEYPVPVVASDTDIEVMVPGDHLVVSVGTQECTL